MVWSNCRKINYYEKQAEEVENDLKVIKVKKSKSTQKIDTGVSRTEMQLGSESLGDSVIGSDVKELLLHYMKLTFELRNKNLTKGQEQPVTSHESFQTTDCDSVEDDTCALYQQPIFASALKCPHCSKILGDIHSLKNHCKRKHGTSNGKHVLCDKCPTQFYTDFEFNRHYQTHNSVRNYLCHLCSKKFVQKSTLEVHLKYHQNDRRYLCEVCPKKFITNNHLKRHSLIHTNQRDYKCEPCDRSFRHKDHLRRHLKSVHIGVRSHNCDECHKSFMYQSQLKFHQQSHTSSIYKCMYCSRNFIKRIALRLHMEQCKGLVKNATKKQKQVKRLTHE
ncbi:hypothetical protein RUM43_003713 [Polyplax serrata]|uniref:C2H2-type domain-containing protein n=1 Tax=Polyplax serrata TaxID=468196 RepID=A0AAN8PPQ1_POLSC